MRNGVQIDTLGNPHQRLTLRQAQQGLIDRIARERFTEALGTPHAATPGPPDTCHELGFDGFDWPDGFFVYRIHFGGVSLLEVNLLLSEI